MKKSNSLNGSGYAENVQNVNVHTADPDGYHFLLGASIIKFGSMWVVAYGQSREVENDATTRFACKYSYDNCQTWSSEYVIADADAAGFARGHGVLYSDGETLYAICPSAKFDGGSAYETMKFSMELYTMNAQTMQWSFVSTVMEDDFWPLCEPMTLSNGDLLIAGMECESGSEQPAVAIAKNGDLTQFERIVIPNTNKISVWGESTVIDYGEKLVLFTRANGEYAAVSESTDNGQTWSALELSNLAYSKSKMFGGTLSTGQKYLIYNLPSSSYRSVLGITVGDYDGSYGFGNIYIIKSGYEKESQFGFARQWAYPYAVEDNGYLYVVYAENKEDCELSIIPISSLAFSEEAVIDVDNGEFLTNLKGAPKYKVLKELVDVEEKAWWSGDGTDDYVDYSEIDGIPVVARRQSKTSGNQTLRTSFDVDEGDRKNLAIVMTFYSAVDFSTQTTINSGNRILLGNSTLKESTLDPRTAGNYTINTRNVELKASTTNLWSDVKAGWNTWIIEFDCAESVELNTFFSVFIGTTAVTNGDILYALSSVKLVSLEDSTANAINTYYGVPSREAPSYQTLKEFVDTENGRCWWSGDGTNGTDNVSYTQIDGTPVVASIQKASGNQVLRRVFDYDYSKENFDRLAFEITFWSAIDFSSQTTLNSNNRLFFGDCSSKSGDYQNFSTDYTTNKASYYRASAATMWSNVKAGWNTMLISFSALGTSRENLNNFNTFFALYLHNNSVSTGDTVYAIASLKLVRLNAKGSDGETPKIGGIKQNVVFQSNFKTHIYIPKLADKAITGVTYEGTPLVLAERVIDGATYYVATVEVGAEEANEKITLNITFTCGGNAYTQTVSTNIVAYANALAAYPEYADLAKAMLYYAKCAAPTAGIEATRVETTKVAAVNTMAQGTPVTGASVAICSAPVFTFTLDNTYTGVIRFTWKSGDKTLSVEKEVENDAIITLNELKLYDFTETITVSYKDGITFIEIGSYNLAAYAASEAGLQNVDFVNALYDYAEQAKAYILAK